MKAPAVVAFRKVHSIICFAFTMGAACGFSEGQQLDRFVDRCILLAKYF